MSAPLSLRCFASTPLLLSVFGLCARAGEAPAAVFPGPLGSRVHVEAIDPGIVRLWVAREGVEHRAPSLATEVAPTARVPLRVRQEGSDLHLSTDALSLRVNLQSLGLDVAEQAVGVSLFSAGTIAFEAGKPGWSFTRGLAVGERLTGLGQDNHGNGRLDRRGVIRELWAGQQIESGNVTAEYPVPFLIGILADGRAYGLFFDNAHRLRFDLGKTQPDQLRLDADGGEMDLYVIAGPKIADVIERYTRLTGRPSLPPLWALGYWQSRCTYYDWKALDDAYQQLHDRGFPVDVMVIDYDWPEIANNFEWAKRWSGEGFTPADKIAGYAKRGVKIVMSQSGPMIRQESPTFASGWAMGVFATDGKGNPIECGHYGGKLLDFTHPQINDWLWPQVSARIKDGVAGWWLDLTEPEGEPPQTVYHGGTPANAHNEYSLRATRSFEGVQLRDHPDRRPFILTRAGPAGLQRHHAAVWTGDVYSDYATFRAHAPEMLNSGLSGLAWWTSDSGGFMNGYYKDDQMGAHARLYERWMQFSAFSPIARAHKAGGVSEPYQFGPAVEQSSRHYLKLRYRLLPYIYSYAWQASQTGVPLVRPLALEFQDDPRSVAARGDQYFFGRELLVAPAMYEGVTNRSVYLPPGRWIDWDLGYEYEGGRDWVVAAPQNRIPLIVRAGAIIPLAPEMLHTGEKPWDPLTLEIFPEGKSGFTLYRDDGASFGYRRGENTVTRITVEEQGDRVEISIVESNEQFTPATYLARLHLDRKPEAVAVAGRATAFEWDESARVLSFAIDGRAGVTHEASVTLTGVPLAARRAPLLKADVVDPRGEVSGSPGKPVPHFYPPPSLPARVKAINYDKGGEGVAFHSTRPLPEKTSYRADDFSIAETSDAGGGFVLAGLRASEWARYTIECGCGGYFDLSVRGASGPGGGKIRFVAGDIAVATADLPATGGGDRFADIRVPNVYLNPGEASVMVYVDSPGFSLNTFEFTPAANPPSRYAAALGARRGFCEVISPGEGAAGRGLLKNLGRVGSGVTLGIMASAKGPARLRVRYANGSGKPVVLAVQIGANAAESITVPPRGEGPEWQTFDIAGDFEAGGNRVTLSGVAETWDSVTLDELELLKD